MKPAHPPLLTTHEVFNQAPELVDYKLFRPEDVLCWPAGTGYALADWLTSRGHEPRFADWGKR